MLVIDGQFRDMINEDSSVDNMRVEITREMCEQAICDLPPDRPAGCPIKVTYGYDVNQRMHCKFEDVQSSKVLEVDLSLDSDGSTSQRIQQMEFESDERQS